MAATEKTPWPKPLGPAQADSKIVGAYAPRLLQLLVTRHFKRHWTPIAFDRFTRTAPTMSMQNRARPGLLDTKLLRRGTLAIRGTPKQIVSGLVVCCFVVLSVRYLANSLSREENGNVPVKQLDVEKVRFVAKKRVGVAGQQDAGDDADSGVYVVQKTDESTDIFKQYAEARKQYQTQHRPKNGFRVPRIGLTIVARLAGDGTGSNHSFSTEIGKPREIFLAENTIVILGSCSFKGPHLDFFPHPMEYYLSAELPALPRGKYSILIRVSPEGEVFDQYRSSEQWKSRLPDFGLLRCEFEITDDGR